MRKANVSRSTSASEPVRRDSTVRITAGSESGPDASSVSSSVNASRTSASGRKPQSAWNSSLSAKISSGLCSGSL